jgi:hypothetical protein
VSASRQPNDLSWPSRSGSDEPASRAWMAAPGQGETGGSASAHPASAPPASGSPASASPITAPPAVGHDGNVLNGPPASGQWAEHLDSQQRARQSATRRYE